MYLLSLFSSLSSEGKRPKNLLFEILKGYHKQNVSFSSNKMMIDQRTGKSLVALGDKFHTKVEKFLREL